MELSLDCGSGDLATQSLSGLFQCKPEDLTNFVKPIDLEAIYRAHWQSLEVPSDEYLFQKVIAHFGRPKIPASAFWFHLTRTTRDNNFSHGILPLGEVLDPLWESLIELAPTPEVQLNLINLKNLGVRDFLYNLKSPNEIHWGPYAILVREVAFHACPLRQHDYLDMPEIIEDICNGYSSAYGTSIIDVYKNTLLPCIVKFRSSFSDIEEAEACVKTALCYVRTYARDEPPDRGAIYCFDAEGMQVPASAIVDVEFIKT